MEKNRKGVEKYRFVYFSTFFTYADYVIITLFFIRDLFILAQDLKRYVYVDVKWYVSKSRSFLVGISRL